MIENNEDKGKVLFDATSTSDMLEKPAAKVLTGKQNKFKQRAAQAKQHTTAVTEESATTSTSTARVTKLEMDEEMQVIKQGAQDSVELFRAQQNFAQIVRLTPEKIALLKKNNFTDEEIQKNSEEDFDESKFDEEVENEMKLQKDECIRKSVERYKQSLNPKVHNKSDYAEYDRKRDTFENAKFEHKMGRVQEAIDLLDLDLIQRNAIFGEFSHEAFANLLLQLEYIQEMKPASFVGKHVRDNFYGRQTTIYQFTNPVIQEGKLLSQDDHMLHRFYFAFGKFAGMCHQYDLALSHHLKALVIRENNLLSSQGVVDHYEDLFSKRYLFESHAEIGQTYEMMAQRLAAQEHFNKAVAFGDSWQVRSHMGDSYAKSDQALTAIENFQKAIDLAVEKKEFGTDNSITIELFDKIHFLRKQNKMHEGVVQNAEQAIQHLRFQVSTQQHEEQLVPKWTKKMADAWFEIEGGEAQALEGYRACLEQGLELEFQNKNSEVTILAQCFHQIGKIYKRQNDAEQAILNFKKGIDLIKDKPLYKIADMTDLYQDMAEMHEIIDDLDSALKYFEETLERKEYIFMQEEQYISKTQLAIERIKQKQLLKQKLQ